jgi:hypothetical protein
VSGALEMLARSMWLDGYVCGGLDPGPWCLFGDMYSIVAEHRCVGRGWNLRARGGWG